jgi:hypothetical protein
VVSLRLRLRPCFPFLMAALTRAAFRLVTQVRAAKSIARQYQQQAGISGGNVRLCCACT